MQDPLLRSLLEHHKQVLVTSNTDLIRAITARDFLTVQADAGIPPSINSGHLIALYEDGIVGRKAGRKYYEKLKALGPDEKCAYCLQRPVEQIDHYYPKSKYSKLSVAPANLVPVCEKCNKAKLAKIDDDPDKIFIHPYADLVEQYVWLEAALVEGGFGTVRFMISPFQEIPEAFKARIYHTFKTLGLGRLYSISANDEISATRYELSQKFATSGVEGVRAHLKLRRESCEDHDRNSWRSAAYRCWERSDDFVAGGWQKP